MEQTTDIKKVLIKKYHALCLRLGLDEATKKALLSQFDAESSKDLSVAELVKVVNALGNQARGLDGRQNQWRKRVLGAIIGYMDIHKEGFMGWDGDSKIKYAKGTALKASGMTDTDIDKAFNRIPLETLVKISAMFNKKK